MIVIAQLKIKDVISRWNLYKRKVLNNYGGLYMKKLIAEEYKRFEDIKQIREDGSEFWSARELAVALDYTQWRNFTGVIKRAMIACENSGHDIFHDFAEVSKIVEAGVHLSVVSVSDERGILFI